MKVPIPPHPKRKLGQNFLHDENVQEKIVSFFEPMPEDSVLEIGAGTGALTRKLAPLVKRMIAVEFDGSIVPFLQDIPNLEVVQSDIRKVDLCSIAGNPPLRVIGNLPYYISSAILSFLIERRKCLADMVLLFQEEVAARIISLPSREEYGFLSVLAQYYCEIERGFRISKNSFVPRPEIESRILRFRFQSDVRIEYKKFTSFLAIAFSHRRKKLRNNLLRGLSVEPQELDRVFARLNISETARAENLTAANYENLIEAVASPQRREVTK